MRTMWIPKCKIIPFLDKALLHLLFNCRFCNDSDETVSFNVYVLMLLKTARIEIPHYNSLGKVHCEQ
jgi:hypothetical protein